MLGGYILEILLRWECNKEEIPNKINRATGEMESIVYIIYKN